MYTTIYGSPIPSYRAQLWEHLKDLRARITKSWVLLRDFDEILAPSEVSGGTFNAIRVVVFAAILSHCNLVDLGLIGGRYTWFQVKVRGGFVKG